MARPDEPELPWGCVDALTVPGTLTPAASRTRMTLHRVAEVRVQIASTADQGTRS